MFSGREIETAEDLQSIGREQERLVGEPYVVMQAHAAATRGEGSSRTSFRERYRDISVNGRRTGNRLSFRVIAIRDASPSDTCPGI
jgi:hypothetical protein